MIRPQPQAAQTRKGQSPEGQNSRPGAGLRRSHIGAVLVLVAGLAACSPIERRHGYIPLEEDLARVEVGLDTRESVVEKVGAPGAAGVLNQTGFYYVASRFRTIAFLAPQEIEREVLAIRFNEAGVVTNIERFGLEDGQVVTLSRRVTEGVVEDSTFIRQLLGNVGRVDAGTLLGGGEPINP